jgi:hypothetical protein
VSAFFKISTPAGGDALGHGFVFALSRVFSRASIEKNVVGEKPIGAASV